MPALSNTSWELFATYRAGAFRTGEKPEESYVKAFGVESHKQAVSRSRNLLQKQEIINRIEELESQIARAALVARADGAITKEKYDNLLWEMINTPPDQIDSSTPWANTKYDKEGNMLPMKPEVNASMSNLGKSLGFHKQTDTTIVLSDWRPTKPVRDVGPRTRNLEEAE